MIKLFRVFMVVFLLGLTGSAAAQDVRIMPPLLRITDTAVQPVRLVGVNVDSRVVGHLAKTTVELSFRNPNNRILEGELQFPLLVMDDPTNYHFFGLFHN